MSRAFFDAVIKYRPAAIRIEVGLFTYLLQNNDLFVGYEPVSDVSVLRTGLYSYLSGVEIYVNKAVPEDCVQLRINSDWSPPIRINSFIAADGDFERLLKAKALW